MKVQERKKKETTLSIRKKGRFKILIFFPCINSHLRLSNGHDRKKKKLRYLTLLKLFLVTNLDVVWVFFYHIAAGIVIPLKKVLF